MLINTKGKRNDDRQRELKQAISRGERRLHEPGSNDFDNDPDMEPIGLDKSGGIPIKRQTPVYGPGKHTRQLVRAHKKGDRRRVNMELHNARYDEDSVIFDDPNVAPSRLVGVALNIL